MLIPVLPPVQPPMMRTMLSRMLPHMLPPSVPALDQQEQAISRIHRIGQAYPVRVKHFVVQVP